MFCKRHVDVVGRCLVDLELKKLMSKTIELESRIDSVIAELRTSRDLISSARLALELDRLMEQAEADPGFWISEVARAPIVDRRSLELALLRLRALEARDFCAGVLALLLLVIERSQKSPSRVGEDAAAALLEALDQYGLDRFFVGQTFSSELGAGIVLHLARTWPALKLSALFRQLSPYLLFEYLREKEWVRSFFPGAAKLVEQVPEIFESSGYSLADPVELVDCAAALGELARVTEVIRSWPKPGARARAEARMAAILAERGSFDEALAWASISEPSPGVFLAEEADRQRQLGDLQRAKYLAGQILDTKVRMGCFSRVAWDFLRRQEANAAIECLRVVIDSIDEPSDLELILEEAPKMNEPGKIPGELAPEFDAMLAEMWSWSDRELEEARNRLQCALVEVWGYLGHRAKAWKLSGLVAASRERAELIASLVAFSGGEEDAAELLKKALKEARGLKVRWQRCAALLHVASAASRVRPAAAREIFSEVIALARELTDIDSTGLTESVQESIVEWLAGTPAFEGCDWCYFEMLEFIAETVSLRSLLTHAVVLGEKMDSDEVRSRWVGRFIEVAAAHEAAEALGLLARQSAARGLMDEAISCLENILESERVEFQLSLASQLWHQDRTHAQRLLDEAERIARKPTRERYDTRRFNVIFGLAGFGMVERAVALASLVRPAEERCRAFAELAFLSLGDLGIARRHLVTFLRTVKNRDLRERLPFDEGALVALSGELATFDPGGYRRLDLFDSALWRILPRVPEESRRILFLGTWFRLVVENLPIHEARPLLDKAQYRVLELKDQRARDEGIKQISRSLLQAGELGWVARLAEAFSSRFQYATLLCEVALIEARGGKEREAAEHLSRALDALANEKLKNDGSPHQILALPAIRALQNHELRDQSMALVLAPLLRIELDTERAKALLKLGEELVLGEPDPWVVQVLVELCLHIERAEMPRYALELEEHRIGLLAALGEFDEALAAAKAIDSSNWIREHSLLRIVLELARQGHAEVCFTVLGKIKTEEYRSKALKATTSRG